MRYPGNSVGDLLYTGEELFSSRDLITSCNLGMGLKWGFLSCLDVFYVRISVQHKGFHKRVQ